MRPLCFVLFVFSTVAMSADNEIENRIRYGPIGDSYSIGEGASPNESWPALLAQHLSDKGAHVDLVANPSRTGWTTQQAIDRELPIFRVMQPNLQGVNEETFRKRFVLLVDQMLDVLSTKKRLLIITIPDFGVTPDGPRYAHGRNISEGVAAFNKIVSEESAKRGLRVVDVFELSKKMGNDHSLVAADGLHPSAKEYAEWEKIILPAALELLTNESALPNRKSKNLS